MPTPLPVQTATNMDKSLSALSFAQIQPFVCELHPAVPLQLLQLLEGKDEGRRLAALLIGTAMEGLVEAKSCIPFYFQVQQSKLVFKLSSLGELVELVREAQPKHTVVGVYVSGEVDTAAVNLWGKVKSQHKGAQALLTLQVAAEVEFRCLRTSTFPQYRLAFLQEVPITLQTRQLAHIQPVQRLSQSIQTLKDQLKQCQSYLLSQRNDPAALKLLLRCAKVMRAPRDCGEESDVELVKYLSECVKVQLHVSDVTNAQL